MDKISCQHSQYCDITCDVDYWQNALGEWVPRQLIQLATMLEKQLAKADHFTLVDWDSDKNINPVMGNKTRYSPNAMHTQGLDYYKLHFTS